MIKKIHFVTTLVLLLNIVNIEPKLGSYNVLLADVASMAEQKQHVAHALVLALSPLRNMRTEPCVLPVVLEVTGDVESAVLGLLHDDLPPVVVVVCNRSRTIATARAPVFSRTRRLWRPRRTLVLLGAAGPARLQLGRLLNALRASPFWAAGAQQMVALTDWSLAASVDSQRALARAGILKAFGIATDKDASAIGIHFNPVRRPSTPPRISTNLRLPNMEVDLKNVPVIFAFATRSLSDESRCMSGNVHQSYSAMDIHISLIIESSKVRAFCFTQAGVMNMPIEFVIRPPGGPVVPPGYDIDVVAVATSLTGSLGLDFMYPHSIAHLCVYVRRALPLPFVQSLLRGFSPNTWIATFAALVGIFVVRCLARDYGGLTILLEVWRTFLTGSFSENRGAILLGIGLGTSLFGVIVTTAFLSNASSFLSVPPHEAELRTLKDVARRIRHIHCVESDIQGYNSSEKDDMSLLFERLQLQPSLSGMALGAHRSAFSPDNAILIPDDVHFYLTNLKENVNEGYTRLRQVEECVVTALPRSFLAKKHSQFTDVFETILQRGFQAGILTYISERTKEKATRESSLSFSSTGPIMYRPYALGLDHLWGAFFAWGCGLLLSILGFVLEKLFRKFSVSRIKFSRGRLR